MIWIKQKSEEGLQGYTCSCCGSLWLTVDTEADTPNECQACGETAETAEPI